MKHSIKMILIAGALGLAAQAQASMLDVSAFGGYTTLAMGDINDTLTKFAGSSPVTKITGGYYVGAEAGIPIFPFLKIGPRVSYVAGQGKVDASGTGGNVSTMDAALIPLELGISTDWSLPLSGLSIQGGIWGGYGLGSMKVSQTGNAVGSETLTGNGFVGEVGAQARYGILPFLSLGLDLGYRLANIASMSVSSSDGAFSGASGSFKKAGSNNDATVDFSGLNVGGALSFNF